MGIDGVTSCIVNKHCCIVTIQRYLKLNVMGSVMGSPIKGVVK